MILFFRARKLLTLFRALIGGFTFGAFAFFISLATLGARLFDPGFSAFLTFGAFAFLSAFAFYVARRLALGFIFACFVALIVFFAWVVGLSLLAFFFSK